MRKSGNKHTGTPGSNDLTSYLIIALAAFAVYSNSLLNEFVYDDELLVADDSTITSISNIPKFFTGTGGYSPVFIWFYRPVVSTSLTIDYAIWKLNPFGFHLTNVLLHVINCLLLFKFLKLIFLSIPAYERQKKKKGGRFTEILSLPFIGTLLFAVHPIHTEAVSWVSGRTDLLAFTFILASFISYLEYTEAETSSNRSMKFFLTCLFYIISLLAKEVAIVLPAMIILYDIIIKKYKIKYLLKERGLIYLSLIVISILYLLLRNSVLEVFPASEKKYYFYGKDFVTAFFTMAQTIPLYIKLLFVPVGLLYQYNGYLPYVNSFLSPEVLKSFVLVVILTVLTIYFYKKNSMISYSIIFFSLSLLPVMNIAPTSNLAAERFLYLPSISLIIVITYIGFKLETTTYLQPFYTASVLITLIFVILTISRNADWKNNERLYLSADGKPGVALNVNLGNLYVQRKQYDKAEMYYRRAIQSKDNDPLANSNMGRAFMLEGKFDSAYYYINKAYQFDTLNPEPRFTLALLYELSDRTSDAINEMEKLQKIEPDYKNSKHLLDMMKSQLQNDTTSQTKEDHK